MIKSSVKLNNIEFSLILNQASVSHDPSEKIYNKLTWCTENKHLLFFINVKNIYSGISDE